MAVADGSGNFPRAVFRAARLTAMRRGAGTSGRDDETPRHFIASYPPVGA